MNCHHVQNLISAFIDRELESDEKRELRKHLMACAECEAEYHEFLILKDFLENVAAEPYDFDPISNLQNRLLSGQHSFLTPSYRIIWFRRLSLIAACVTIYLFTAGLLFPVNQNISKLAENPNHVKNPDHVLTTSVSTWDQNISIDQSVSVYQASLILP